MRNAYRTHRTWIEHNGPIRKGYHIHHLDGDSSNDCIENLVCVSPEMHFAMHEDRYRELRLGKDYAAMRFLANDKRHLDNYEHPRKGVKASDETKARMSDAWKNRKPDTDETRKRKSEGQKNRDRTYTLKRQAVFFGINYYYMRKYYKDGLVF